MDGRIRRSISPARSFVRGPQQPNRSDVEARSSLGPVAPGPSFPSFARQVRHEELALFKNDEARMTNDEGMTKIRARRSEIRNHAGNSPCVDVCRELRRESRIPVDPVGFPGLAAIV